MEHLRLLWTCVAHDYALHEVKHATRLARRICGSSSGQKALDEVQLSIMDELAARKIADDQTKTAS